MKYEITDYCRSCVDLIYLQCVNFQIGMYLRAAGYIIVSEK